MPVLKPAWDHLLLLHITPPVALTLDASQLAVTFSPGTLERSGDLQTWTPQPEARSPLVLPRSGLGPAGFFRLQTNP
jgi:hypothetical protein